MFSDPVSDFLIRIKNGYLAGKKSIKAPHSKYKENIAKILEKEGYLGKVSIDSAKTPKRNIKIELLYKDDKPKLSQIKLVSKTSQRTYVTKNDIPVVLGGLGVAIISTSEGLLTGRQARKKGIGGEVVCKIW